MTVLVKTIIRNSRFAATGIFLTALSLARADAAPVTYVFSGLANGSLGGTAFGERNVVVTATGDTANAVNNGGSVYTNIPSLTTVGIAGFGTFNFSNPGMVFVNQPSSVIGFNPGAGSDIIQYSNAAYATYTLQTPLGPIPFPAPNPSVPSWVSIPTSGGALTVTFMTANSFQAITAGSAVPEPAFAGMAALGLLGVWRWGNRMRKPLE